MPNDVIPFNAIANTLRDELSLVDDKEYQKMKQKEIADKHPGWIEKLNKGLDEIELNDLDYIALDELDFERNLPKSILRKVGWNEYTLNSKSLYELQKEKPSVVRQFMHELSNSDWNYDAEDDYEEEDIKYGAIEDLLERYPHANEEEKENIVMELEDRFMVQSQQIQVQIIKTVFPEATADRGWWYRVLLGYWWDDDVIPSVELTWQRYGEPECARLIAHRFPMEYVTAHQTELGKAYYLAVCLRLVRESSFVIDKSRLSKRQYYHIMAALHIHLDETEARNLLFGHVLQYLDVNYKPKSFFIDNGFCHALVDVDELFIRPDKYLRLMLEYKPSLLFLPEMKFYINTLVRTGNTRAVANFLVWNNYLQQNIPSFISKEQNQSISLPQVKERFWDYRSWSWERLMELAIETFPIDRDCLSDEFGHVDDDYNGLDDFVPY